MKKGIPLIIGGIFILTIMMVSFWGLRGAAFTQVVYSTNVEVLNSLETRNGIPTMEVTFVPGMDGILLRWRVLPAQTTDMSVEIISSTDAIRIEHDDRYNQARIYMERFFWSSTITITTNDNRTSIATFDVQIMNPGAFA